MRSHELAAKGSLVSQLKQLSQQHEQLLAAYEGRVAAKLAEAAASGGVLPTGIKRPGGPLVETPEQKRQRQLVDRERRKKELWDEIIRIMDRIRKHNKSEAFRQPVDPIKLKIPDYPIIIKQPMDIGTVLRKLRSTPRAYASPADVAYDVRLIWGNARAYNGALHPVTACANILSEMFEKLWGQANIEHKWQVEVKREEREEQTFAERGPEGPVGGDDDLVSNMRRRRNMLADLIAAKDVQESLPPGSLGVLAPERDMSFEEKRKLSAHMASLPGEKLAAVLDIIEEHEELPADDGSSGELELDMDTLSMATLWRLKAYVDGVLTAATGAPPKKTSAHRASGGGGAPAKHVPGAAVAGGAGGASAPATDGGADGGALAPPAGGSAPVVGGAAQAAPPPQPPSSNADAAATGGAAAPAPAAAAAPTAGLPPPAPSAPGAPPAPPRAASPTHSGGGSAGEVVGSTAGGAGMRPPPHMLGDACTVAQSGTNARHSAFVKARPRAPLPPGAATDGKPGSCAAAGGGAAAALTPGADDAWAALASGGAPSAAPAADTPAAAAPAPAGAAAPAAAAAPADTAAAGPASAAAAPTAAGDGGDMWDEFAAKAAAEEQKLAAAAAEKEARQRQEEDAKRAAEQARQQAEREQQQQSEAAKAAAAEELKAKGAPPGAATEDAGVLKEMDKLLSAAGDTSAMDVDGGAVGASDEEEGDADDGGGFDD